MKTLMFATALAAAAASMAHAQRLDVPDTIKGAAPSPSGRMDADAAPMLADPDELGAFARWYAQQKRPAVVVYFNREMAELPPGWEDGERLLIEQSARSGNAESSRTTTVGRQVYNAQRPNARSQLARLFEQSLATELKRNDVRLADGGVLQRKLAASNRDRRTDIEYESLSRSARFVLEVQLVVLNGAVEAVANLKDIRNGDMTATVRQSVPNLSSAKDVDAVSRALVRRLMRFQVS